MYDNLRTSYLWQHVCQQDRVRRQQQKQSYLQGTKEEVKTILKKYSEFPTAMQGLGYKEVVQYLNKEITKEERQQKDQKQHR